MPTSVSEPRGTYESSAPNITPDWRKMRPKHQEVCRAHLVAVVDGQGDGLYETVLTSPLALPARWMPRPSCAAWGPRYMLDGGGSTQLICRDQPSCFGAPHPQALG